MMNRKILVAAGILTLSGCTTFQDGKPLAQMTFNHITPKPLYVASYEPVEVSMPSVLPEGFVADPAKIVHDYLTNRFEAVGTQGKFKATITSSIVEHDVVASRNKFGEILGVDKKDHYVIKVTIALKSYGLSEFSQASSYARDMSTQIRATRDLFVSEHVSLVEREKRQLEALDFLVDDLDIPLQKLLREDFNILR